MCKYCKDGVAIVVKDVFNTKIEVELTLRELEMLIVKLRVANKIISGEVHCELEEKLENIAVITKMSI